MISDGKFSFIHKKICIRIKFLLHLVSFYIVSMLSSESWTRSWSEVIIAWHDRDNDYFMRRKQPVNQIRKLALLKQISNSTWSRLKYLPIKIIIILYMGYFFFKLRLSYWSSMCRCLLSTHSNNLRRGRRYTVCICSNWIPVCLSSNKINTNAIIYTNFVFNLKGTRSV